MKKLPDPGPLSSSVPIPEAEPPDAMKLIAVPTGVNNRVAAYAYRGGSVFDRRDFYIGAAPAGPAELAGKLLAAWVGYSLSGAGATAGLDRMPVALHGWSYAQTDPELKATLQAGLKGFRAACVPLSRSRRLASREPGEVPTFPFPPGVGWNS